MAQGGLHSHQIIHDTWRRVCLTDWDIYWKYRDETFSQGPTTVTKHPRIWNTRIPNPGDGSHPKYVLEKGKVIDWLQIADDLLPFSSEWKTSPLDPSAAYWCRSDASSVFSLHPWQDTFPIGKSSPPLFVILQPKWYKILQIHNLLHDLHTMS